MKMMMEGALARALVLSLVVAGAGSADSSVVPTSGLVAWFKSLEAAEPTWASSVGSFEATMAIGSGTVPTTDGDGAGGQVRHLRGGTTDQVDFGDVLPSTFTIFSLTRYTGDNKGRILRGTTGNWLHGHHNGNVGVAYYDTWRTSSSSSTTTDWVALCCQNGGSSLIMKDGLSVGTSSGGSSPSGININNMASELSDWAIAELITWNRDLDSAELTAVSGYLQEILEQGTATETINNIAVSDVWSFGRTSTHWALATGSTIKFAVSEDGDAWSAAGGGPRGRLGGQMQVRVACKPTTLYGAPCDQANEAYGATSLGVRATSVPPQVTMGAWELLQTGNGALALFRGSEAIWALSTDGDVWSKAQQGFWQKRDSVAYDTGSMVASGSKQVGNWHIGATAKGDIGFFHSVAAKLVVTKKGDVWGASPVGWVSKLDAAQVRAGPLHPVVPCEVRPWEPWLDCSVCCGGGTQVRYRRVRVASSGRSYDCPTLTERRACNPQACAPDPGAAHFAAERTFLQDLYAATGGASGWFRTRCWLSVASHCDWHGVSCAPDVAGSVGPVVRLALPGNNLIGTVPDLTRLSSLEYLSLARNPDLVVSQMDISRLDDLTALYLPPQQLLDTVAPRAMYGEPLHDPGHEVVTPKAAAPSNSGTPYVYGNTQQWPGAARYWRVRQLVHLHTGETDSEGGEP